MQGIYFFKHVIEGGMDGDDRVHADFIFDLLEALRRCNIGFDHRLRVREHLHASLREILVLGDGPPASPQLQSVII